jgi:MFS family permease
VVDIPSIVPDAQRFFHFKRFVGRLFGPSVDISTAGIPDIARDLHTTPLIATLGITTYVLGFAFGPLVWAPLSEKNGRRPSYIISWVVFTIFQIPCALAKNPGKLSL